MSRVLTFSRFFPAYHPKKGEATYFVEKILSGIFDRADKDFNFEEMLANQNSVLWNNDRELFFNFYFSLNWTKDWDIKGHTIRAGNRWEVGMKFSPRVWSGKPYQSKQITISPDIEVKKVWDIEILFETNQIHIGIPNGVNQWLLLSAGDVAKNDGLEVRDFYNWFDTAKNRKQKIIKAQIICWNENISYGTN